MTRKSCPRFSFQIGGSREEGLLCLLREAWKSGLKSGIIVYDPALAEKREATPFRFHHLPRRAGRPGAARSPDPPPEGIFLPHAPCPFDGERFVEEREVARLERGGRAYHLTCNRFPVTPLHFLVIRSLDAPPAVLPQHIHGPEEIEDLLFFLEMVGPPYRAYFNANRGADNSQSGSSVNHWHFQVFAYPTQYASPLLEGRAELSSDATGLTVGSVADWPARHIFVEGEPGDVPRMAAFLWDKFRRLHEWNVSYNLEVAFFADTRFRAFLFPRSPGPEVEVPGAGRLSPNFGGWELSGDIVVPSRGIFEWVERHPAEAVRRTMERLKQTTRAAP